MNPMRSCLDDPPEIGVVVFLQLADGDETLLKGYRFAEGYYISDADEDTFLDVPPWAWREPYEGEV